MDKAKIILIVVVLLLVAAGVGLSQYKAYEAQTQLGSVQIYWNETQAVATVSTTLQMREQSYLHKLLAKASIVPETPMTKESGLATVYTFAGSSWTPARVPGLAKAPARFDLWPFNGTFYTMEEGNKIREWNGKTLVPAKAEQTTELRRVFPALPEYYAVAGDKGSKQPWAVVIDPVTLTEWHAYQNLATAKAGNMPFTVGGKELTLKVQRSPEPTLTITGNGQTVHLWDATMSTKTEGSRF